MTRETRPGRISTNDAQPGDALVADDQGRYVPRPLASELSKLTENVATNLDLGTAATHDATDFATVAGMQAYVRDQIAAALAAGSTVPAAPTITSVTPSSGQVVVAFTAGANGGTAITGFTVSAYVNGKLSAVVPVSGASSPLTLTGLADGTTYTCTVHATNANGDSAESAPSAAFLPPAVAPGAPTFGSVNPSGTSVGVFFTPPFSNGGSPITGYTATATSSDGGTTRTATGASSPLTIANLTSAKHYTVHVKATNAIGDSGNSSDSASFLTGSNPVTTAAKTQLGFFPGSPDANGVKAIKIEEALIGRQIKQVQVYCSQTPAGAAGFDGSSVWGVTSDSSTTASDGSKCLGFDTIKSRVQLILNVPIAFGNQGQTAAQRLAALDRVLNNTTDGTNDVRAAFKLAGRNYYRDRNLSTTVNGAQDLGTGAFLGGTGVLTVASNAPLTIGVPCWVDAPSGVFKVAFTGKAGAGGLTTLTGCTATRAAVGGGSGSNTVANGAYVGSGTGWTNYVGLFGWELDGDWYPWGTLVQPGDTSITAVGDRGQATLSAKYVATDKHVIDLFRAYGWDSFKSIASVDETLFQAREADVIAPLSAANTADAASKYIHGTGLDFYDDNGGGLNTGWNPTTLTWSDPTATFANRLAQLQAHKAMADRNGLAVCYPEWACVSGSGNGGDDPTFITGMVGHLNTLTPVGSLNGTWNAGELAFHNYFGVFPTWSLNSGKPNARAAYNANLGA